MERKIVTLKEKEVKPLIGDFYAEIGDSVLPMVGYQKGVELQAKIAYVVPDDDCFYFYKGNDIYGDKEKEPGFYKKEDGSYRLIRATSKKDREALLIDKHIRVVNLETILDVLKSSKDKVIAIDNPSMSYVPVIGATDDILKRGIKLAMIKKGINLDSLKDQFQDKNALFNFKQVLKNPDAKLSIMLFARGCEAFGLKYSIIIEELDPSSTVANVLESPVTVSSEDTHPV